MRHPILIVLVGVLSIPPASADISVARKHVSDASLVGKARLSVLLWDVYDVRLYAPSSAFSRTQPFALSLDYLRPVEAEQIVETSIDEMRAQGFADSWTLERWEAELARIIPDVDPTTTLTGIRDALGHALFYCNGELIGRIEDPEFSIAFFDIWLGEKASRPRLRDRLLGGTRS